MSDKPNMIEIILCIGLIIFIIILIVGALTPEPPSLWDTIG